MFYKTGDNNQLNLILKPEGIKEADIKKAIDDAKEEIKQKELQSEIPKKDKE